MAGSWKRLDGQRGVPVDQIVWAGVLAVRRIEPVLKPTDYLVVRLNPNMKEFWG